jgi:hypothetical protein
MLPEGPTTKYLSRPASPAVTVTSTQRKPLTLGISPRISADTSSSVVLGASVDMNQGRYGEPRLDFSTADGRITKAGITVRNDSRHFI